MWGDSVSEPAANQNLMPLNRLKLVSVRCSQFYPLLLSSISLTLLCPECVFGVNLQPIDYFVSP